jgi:hypothetical protein
MAIIMIILVKDLVRILVEKEVRRRRRKMSCKFFYV